MRLAAVVEYDGTDFSGWQRQTECVTVQQAIEAALSKVADHPVVVSVAGRTDAGVHATGQVIHFETISERPAHSWVRGANSSLPETVKLQWVGSVDEEFHARFGAKRRFYRYIILNRPTPSALYRRRATLVKRPLDVARMRSAAKYLEGTHDFSAFRAASCQANSPVREIYRLDPDRLGEWVWFDVEANGFLHHMVRNLAGVLIDVGAGDREPAWVEGVLNGHDRRLAGVTAPPEGLYLVAVEYGVEYRFPEPRVPRFW